MFDFINYCISSISFTLAAKKVSNKKRRHFMLFINLSKKNYFTFHMNRLKLLGQGRGGRVFWFAVEEREKLAMPLLESTDGLEF